MRSISPLPAQQLASAAGRYRADRSLSRTRPKRASGFAPAVPREAATDQSNTQSSRTPEMARLEAVLLLAREPLSTRKLAQLADLTDGTAARTLIRRLRKLYDDEGTAFQVEELAGGYQLLSRPKFGPWLRRLFPDAQVTRLSTPGLETLAVVAYRQPVLRAEIEAVRGVGCGEILRQLMDRDLVRIVGRADDLGRPILYGTTRRFLRVFGLRNLDALPRADILRRANSPPSLSVVSAAEPGESAALDEA
jgi:segregation and condensation protein B